MMSEEEKIIDLENEISFLKDALCEKQKEIEELKKQNYEIVKELKPRVQIDDTEYIERNFISKDKIRKAIEDLEKHRIMSSDDFTIKVLKDLLKEN